MFLHTPPQHGRFLSIVDYKRSNSFLIVVIVVKGVHHKMLLRTRFVTGVPPIVALARKSAFVRRNHTSSLNASLSAFSWLDPFARHLLSFPEYVGMLDAGFAYPYTSFVVALTVMLRSCVSIPLGIWQHRRNDRLAQVVLPEWRVWQKQIPADAWQRQHAHDKSAPTPETEHRVVHSIQRRLAEKWQHLMSLYHCSPTATLATSLAVHIPLFVVVTMLLRQGSIMPDTPLMHETVPWWSPDDVSMSQSLNTRQLLLDKGLDPGLADRLTKIGGPTLADRDPTFIMPLACGSLNMINVELTSWTRQQRRAHESALGLSTEQEADLAEEQPRMRILSNLLRVGAILSIPIACQVPSVLLVYWCTSSFVTLGMNTYFARQSTTL